MTEIEEEEEKKKKKKKKKSSKKDQDHECDGDGEDDQESSKVKKKKKKKVAPTDDQQQQLQQHTNTDAAAEDLADALAGTNLLPLEESSSPTTTTTPVSGGKSGPSKYDKYSADYFHATLEEIRRKCERKLKLKTKDKDDFATTCTNFYATWTENEENDRWLAELAEGKNSKGGGKQQQQQQRTTGQLLEEQTRFASELKKALSKRKKICIKSAMKVFANLKEDSLMGIEEKLVKGAIIAQATPEKLAAFAAQSKANEKLIKRLFGDAELMKDMLLHGGAVKYDYGNAIRIFVECMGGLSSKKKKTKTSSGNCSSSSSDDHKWTQVNHKIALACALELASPIYEFDSMVPIDPVARFHHFVDAHKAGELDPSFPFFTVWEMRQIINCDAPNDQMTWCRKMVRCIFVVLPIIVLNSACTSLVNLIVDFDMEI